MTKPTPARAALARRRLGVLLAIVNGFSSRRIQEILGVPKRQIDDDALWWQVRLHAQNRSDLTRIALTTGLFEGIETEFDGSPERLSRFYARVASDANAKVRRLAEGRARSEVVFKDER